MDIQKWLGEIVDPDTPSNPTISDPRKPLPLSSPRMARSHINRKHGQKPGRSDSSLLDPLTQQEDKPAREQKIHHKERIRENHRSQGSQEMRRESSESLASSHQYVRRPRHKTRPERYEPPKVARQRDSHSHSKRRVETNEPKRKFKRKKNDGGMVQSFHAANVSSDRLTVRVTR